LVEVGVDPGAHILRFARMSVDKVMACVRPAVKLFSFVTTATVSRFAAVCIVS